MKQLNQITIIGSNPRTMKDCQRGLRGMGRVMSIPVALQSFESVIKPALENAPRSGVLIVDLSQKELQEFGKNLWTSLHAENPDAALIVHTSASWLECKMLGVHNQVSIVPRGATRFDWKRAFAQQGISLVNI